MVLKIGIPPKMKEATLWALWWLLVGGATLWLLVGSVAYWVIRGWLPPDTAGWVQAVGAIFTIAIAVAIPLYLRAHEMRVAHTQKQELEIVHSQRLFSLCKEAKTVVDLFPEEDAFADFRVTNEMRRTVLASLIKRLDDSQAGELSIERMQIAVALRIELYDWTKYFGGDKSPETINLWDRRERHLPALEQLNVRAENVIRGLQGLPALDVPSSVRASPVESDPPF